MSSSSYQAGSLCLVQGMAYIAALVETQIGIFCLRQNLNNGVIKISTNIASNTQK